MVMSILFRFIYVPAPSLLMKGISLISFASLVNAGMMEIRGKHMQYSKFWNVGSQRSSAAQNKQMRVSSKSGMLVVYTPAFLAAVASFALFPDQAFRFSLLTSALSIHFFKRIFEVLFVHNYSGWMVIEATTTICLSYLFATASMIYSQHLTLGSLEPPIDLKYAGIVIFLMGISGNFYHHYLLSKLRVKGDKAYKIPKGGLFSVVICPHYLFEILGFMGISCISQTLYAFAYTIGITILLMGRSYATRKWYLSKIEDFPKDVKYLIPYIF